MNLYKLVLVDDEEDVRESIEKKVDWSKLGFEVVGSVSNGEEALELAEQMHIDAVMTDIKMPFMDGLTLCGKLKENYKNTKVVLYSGFDDFELAREAIHLEAEEYLLKPISAKDLENVFGKVKENLDREFDERRNMENLYDFYRKSLPMMREHLLTGMLEGRLSQEQAQTMLLSYEMDFAAPYYAVAVLKPRLHSGKSDLTEQMLYVSVLNLAKEYFEKNIKSYTFLYIDSIVTIARFETREYIQEFVYHMDQVCKMAVRVLDINIGAGVGLPYSSLDKISASYAEAKEALEYQMIIGGEAQVIYIHDVEPKAKTEFLPELSGLSAIIHSMKFGGKTEVAEVISDYAKELKGGMASVQQCQLAFMETMTELLKLMRNYQLDVSEVFGEGFDPYEEIHKFRSIDEFAAWLQDTCNKIRRMIRQERNDSTKIMTEKAKKYIEEHYAESTLSVEELCKYLNVSATYFSTMFKKAVGMSFVSYLTQVRLERAVDLLNSTEDKSYIIAEKVGYTEPNYFSYVFKKKYGISPSKYRTSKDA
ncbi:MAG: response regulator [Lachnospiraceae bacterium]|nr:response regulator [Lachnospiraceae bacterium]